MIRAFSAEIGQGRPDVCIIGAGPVGITLALHLARRGRSVILLESGDRKPLAAAQAQAEAVLDGPFHVPMSLAVQRRLGGTSNLWGGRCVPLEPIDFGARPFTAGPAWPIAAEDVLRHLPQACDYIGCGAPVFTSPPPVRIDNPDFRLDQLERWSTRPRFRNAHGRELRTHPRIDLRLRATATGFTFAPDGRVAAVQVRGPGGEQAAVRAHAVILAGGGLENARLLLAAQNGEQRFGGPDGPLGRYYMGHVYGSVAEIVIADPKLDAELDYFDDGHGSYVRRRFTPSADLQRRENLANAALWPEFPPIHDPAHRSGVLSFAYLALSLPPVGRMVVAESVRNAYLGKAPIRRLPHLLNVVRDFPRTATFVPDFVYRRYLARRIRPGFFERNRARRYALRYHAEHLPNQESRVTLSGTRDATGLPQLRVRLHFTEADTVSLLKTHQHFDTWLQNTGIGRMSWSVPEAERTAHILRQCYDGHHQIGTTRMAASRAGGVVDADCRVFDAGNLFVAGSSVFPTSGEANPTLSAVALAVRLAETLDRELSQI